MDKLETKQEKEITKEERFLTGRESTALESIIALTNRALQAGVIKDINESNTISQSIKVFDDLILRLTKAKK